MTESTTLGSDTSATDQVEGSTGNSNGGQNGTGAEGSTSDTVAIFDGLTEDNRKVAEAKGWDTPDKVLNAYRELETRLGESPVIPDSDDDQEGWDKLHRYMGRPDEPDGYAFEMPADLDENFAYDEDSANKFKAWAHEAGLNPRQAQLLHDRFVQEQNGGFVATVSELQAAGDSAHKEITKQWGDPKSETYKRNVELANRAIRELGGEKLEQAFKDSGVFRADGAVTQPAIAFAMAEVGSRLFSEDKVFSADARATNPFAKDTMNLTAQSQLIRDDPDTARTLAVAGGWSANEIDAAIQGAQSRRR